MVDVLVIYVLGKMAMDISQVQQVYGIYNTLAPMVCFPFSYEVAKGQVNINPKSCNNSSCKYPTEMKLFGFRCNMVQLILSRKGLEDITGVGDDVLCLPLEGSYLEPP